MHKHSLYFQSATILAVGFFGLNLASAQQQPHANMDDLLRRAGINKISQSTAADFTLRDVTGNSVTLSTHRGNLLLLNFWATWCGPCREEMPSMERLYRQFVGQGLTMLAVNEKESATKVDSFMKSYGLSFPVLLDTDGRVSSTYRVWGLPTTFLIDTYGRIIGMKSGAKEWASREVVDVIKNFLVAGGNSGGVTNPFVVGPVEALPARLRVKSESGSVYGQQDSQSETIDKLKREEEVTPMGKTFGSGETWYMIKTKSGSVGWMRAVDLEEPTKAK